MLQISCEAGADVLPLLQGHCGIADSSLPARCLGSGLWQLSGASVVEEQKDCPALIILRCLVLPLCN